MDVQSGITVREGTLADLTRAHAVRAATFEFHHRQAVPQHFRATDSPPPTREFIADLLAQGNGAFLLAEAEGEVIGFATVRAGDAPDKPFLQPARVAVVDSLGVLDAWQGKGAGRALMAAAETWARDHGAERLHLNVWEFNQGAIAFYERLGYRAFSRNMWRKL
jgi:ribosomal protein S18 acetylase RimI-like enzyme